jgi:CubicO group peptidase (beta-lactamase class C family)
VELIKKNMEEIIKKEEVPGISILIIKNNKIVFNEFSGYRFIDEKKYKKIRKDTKFRTASISKLITAIGFMKLLEEKKISLEEDISKYLGFKLRNPSFPDIKITPKMLLSHTSSLRDSNNYIAPMPYTMKDFFCEGGFFYENGAHFSKNKNEKPGEYFNYSNINFSLIASIIENASQTRFDQYMKKNIFDVLSMEASYNVRDFGKNIDNIGVLYKKNGDWIPQIDDYRGQLPKVSWHTSADNFESYDIDKYELGSNGTLFSPYGGARASVEDLGKIMMMLMNGGKYQGKQILKEKTIKLMEKPYWTYNGNNGNNENGLMCCYGMSIHHLTGEYNDKYFKNHKNNLMGHIGIGYGLLSGFFYNSKNKTGIVYQISGREKDYKAIKGKYSAFTILEENLFKTIENIF